MTAEARLDAAFGRMHARLAAATVLTANDLERLSRWQKTTSTWLRKVTALIRAPMEGLWGYEKVDGPVREVFAYEAALVVRAALDAAEELIPAVHAREVADLREQAQTVYHALRARDIAPKLENTAGRTGPEAALFAAKSEGLRDA